MSSSAGKKSPPRGSGSQSMGNKYHYKKRPYKHQVQALKFLLRHGGGALLMEPRTGKTKVAIDYMAVKHQFFGVNRVVVIGPVVAIQVWIDQLKENMPYKYRLTIWDRRGRKQFKDERTDRYALPSYGKDILDIIILNYDAFSTPGRYRTDRKTGAVVKDVHGNKLRSKSRGGRFEVKTALKRWQPQIIILDESHRIKSPSAKKSTALHSIGPVAEERVLLTGTVVTKAKRVFDVYSQWKFLNPERFLDPETGSAMNFSEFKHHYGQWQPMEKWEKFIRPRNTNELHKLVHLDAFSITREECYDLPKETKQIIPVPLEESAQVYDQMAEDMVARIHTGEITEASIRLVQRLRLQQITSGLSKTSPTPDNPKGRLVIIGNEKLRAIEDRLEDLMEADEKVVIGALFKADIQRLIEAGQRLKVPTFAIHGGVKMRDRGAIPGQFAKVSGGAIFIGQPAAAGEAIDLSAASILQWYSLPSSWVNFRQFSDRIALSDKPTFHEFYLAQGTVDFLMYETLMEDGDIGKKMIQSPERLLRLGQSLSD